MRFSKKYVVPCFIRSLIIMLTIVELNENLISENDVTFDDVELMFTQTVTTLKEVSATATGMSKVISRLKPCLLEEISKQKYIEDLKKEIMEKDLSFFFRE
jgi:galactose-1-phosphate uridylyltransferase